MNAQTKPGIRALVFSELVREMCIDLDEHKGRCDSKEDFLQCVLQFSIEQLRAGAVHVNSASPPYGIEFEEKKKALEVFDRKVLAPLVLIQATDEESKFVLVRILLWATRQEYEDAYPY